MKPGDGIVGPAIVASDTTTAVIDPEWQITVEENALLHLKKQSTARLIEPEGQGDSIADPVQLEIFNRSFQSIATQMGDSLRKRR